jgi:asparagine synthase (glutamine-hydrolysing)
MFSIAIFDKIRSKVWLIRDRFGIKPLYYSFDAKRLLFASEQRAITQFPGFTSDIDLEAVAEYFTFQNIISDRTLKSGVKLLPPASIATLDIKTWRLNVERYWGFDFHSSDSTRADDDFTDELDALLTASIKRQLVADVEVGSYLSGGIDSASIVSIASQDHVGLKTFTVGFDTTGVYGREKDFDETRAAAQVSQKFKTDHSSMTITSLDFEKALDSVISIVEEPRVGQSYPNYFAAKLAADKVKVVMSGAGGDELFGGYPWRYGASMQTASSKDFLNTYFAQWNRLIPEGQLRAFLAPIQSQIDLDGPRQKFDSFFFSEFGRKLNSTESMDLCLSFEAKTFLQGLLLVEDKLSMSQSLETRLPFLDNDLVDFAIRLPQSQRAEDSSNFTADGLVGKKILRNLAKRKLGSEISNAKKQGFSSPDETWFRRESSAFISSRLTDPKKQVFDFLNYKYVQDILTDHFSGKVNNRLLIWSILSFQGYLAKK